MIAVNDFSFTHPGATHAALRNVKLEIAQGKFVAIAGANRAGKTTLCHALTGVIPHLVHGAGQGDIHIEGKDTATMDISTLSGMVSFVMQNPAHMLSGIRFTVEEEIAFALENHGMPLDQIKMRVKNAMQQTNILHLAKSSPLHLSGGQLQKVAFASAVASTASLLVLDEPTIFLDPQSTQETFTTLRQLGDEGKTIVIAEQRLENIAEYADRIVVMHNGSIVLDGTPSEVLTSPLLESTGLEWTRYTRVSNLAQKRTLWENGAPLSVTLGQTIAGLMWKDHGSCNN